MIPAWHKSPYRAAGLLVCIGGVFGLAGSIPISYEFGTAFVAAFFFAFVLLFGLMILRTGSRRRSLAIATLWFGLLGGMSSQWILLLGGFGSSSAAISLLLGSLGVIGMACSLCGAGLARLPENEFQGGTLINRNRLGALLVCTGATVGLIGSWRTFLLFFFLGPVVFTLILLLGVFMLREGREGRFLAVATLYFVLAVILLGANFGLATFWFGSVAAWLSSTPLPIAAATVVVGAALRLRPEETGMYGEPPMDTRRDPLAASLVSGGAALGFVTMSLAATSLPFTLLGKFAFASGLVSGLLLFTRQSIGPVLAAASAWFAVLGGAVSIALLLLGGIVGEGWPMVIGVLGIAAMVTSLAGARVELRALRESLVAGL